VAASRSRAGYRYGIAPLIEEFKIPFYILIVILSALTGLYSSIIQKYTIDYDKMTEVTGADEGISG
jgi:uncharacterized membrane protein (DUF106 family)